MTRVESTATVADFFLRLAQSAWLLNRLAPAHQANSSRAAATLLSTSSFLTLPTFLIYNTYRMFPTALVMSLVYKTHL